MKSSQRACKSNQDRAKKKASTNEPSIIRLAGLSVMMGSLNVVVSCTVCVTSRDGCRRDFLGSRRCHTASFTKTGVQDLSLPPSLAIFLLTGTHDLAGTPRRRHCCYRRLLMIQDTHNTHTRTHAALRILPLFPPIPIPAAAMGGTPNGDAGRWPPPAGPSWATWRA